MTLLFRDIYCIELRKIIKVIAELHPKPIKSDWNGSGIHASFSFPYMKEVGGKECFMKFLDKFGEFHQEHIEEYESYKD